MLVEAESSQHHYYGVNDPVAQKLLSKAGEIPSLEPPNDESIRTLCVGGLDTSITKQDLRDFYSRGEIESVNMVVQSQPLGVQQQTHHQPPLLMPYFDITHHQPPLLVPYFNITHHQPPPLMPYFDIPPLMPPQHDRAYYPSMDPQRMGAIIPSQDGVPGGPSGSNENKTAPEQKQQFGYPGMPMPLPGQFYPPFFPQSPPPPPWL